jgi:hypothetical protein
MQWSFAAGRRIAVLRQQQDPGRRALIGANDVNFKKAHAGVLLIEGRHYEPTGRANARPMTGSAKQSRKQEAGLLRRFAPRNDGEPIAL